MKKDPYHTYTDYRPCKPVAPKICWVAPALVLAAVLALAVAVHFGAALLTSLGGL